MAEKQVIVSGEAVGFGSNKWRYVKGLSAEAKAALADKSALVICPRPFNDSDGEWYVVTLKKGRYYDHRLPTDDERKVISEYVAS
jgi:hypothetical protein